jgi:hypothetical protein
MCTLIASLRRNREGVGDYWRRRSRINQSLTQGETMKIVAILVILFSAALASAQKKYDIHPGLCSKFHSNMVCGPSIVTDANSKAVEQVVLSFLPRGSVILYQYDVNGQNGTSTLVNPDGTFAGESITYWFYTSVSRPGKYGRHVRTYLMGTLAKD